jgi:hypothetical protein
MDRPKTSNPNLRLSGPGRLLASGISHRAREAFFGGQSGSKFY